MPSSELNWAAQTGARAPPRLPEHPLTDAAVRAGYFAAHPWRPLPRQRGPQRGSGPATPAFPQRGREWRDADDAWCARARACVAAHVRAGHATRGAATGPLATPVSRRAAPAAGPLAHGQGAAKQQERASSLGGGPEGRHAPPDEMMGNERADKIAWRDLCQQLCQRLSPAPAQPAPGQFE